MNILFKLESNLSDSRPAVCSVPDELDDGTIEGIEKIEDIVLDCAGSLITILWKFEDEPDEKYRESILC